MAAGPASPCYCPARTGRPMLIRISADVRVGYTVSPAPRCPRVLRGHCSTSNPVQASVAAVTSEPTHAILGVCAEAASSAEVSIAAEI
jgi:hypothetical protein